MKSYRIGLISSDGTKNEVIPAAVKGLKAVEKDFTESS